MLQAICRYDSFCMWMSRFHELLVGLNSPPFLPLDFVFGYLEKREHNSNKLAFSISLSNIACPCSTKSNIFEFLFILTCRLKLGPVAVVSPPLRSLSCTPNGKIHTHSGTLDLWLWHSLMFMESCNG